MNSNMEKPYVVGIDIGGTNTVFGIVDARGTIIASSSIKTSGYPTVEEYADEVCKNLLPLIIANGGVDKIRGIGVGAPNGNYYTGTIEFAPNLPWRGILPLAAMFEERLGIPTALTNDANAAALGEMWKGGGRGYDSIVMVTLGTGVGGGVILQGKILTGCKGAGGEIGHMTVDPFDDRVCNCGKTGCLELYASATGIVYETKKALKKYEKSTTLKDITEVTSKDIFDAAKAGDEFAATQVDNLGKKLALAAGNIALMVDPEVFVIGGGVSRAGQILLDAVNAHFKKYTFGKAQETKFVLATLGNDAGIYGAASLMLS